MSVTGGTSRTSGRLTDREAAIDLAVVQAAIEEARVRNGKPQTIHRVLTEWRRNGMRNRNLSTLNWRFQQHLTPSRL